MERKQTTNIEVKKKNRNRVFPIYLQAWNGFESGYFI